MTRESFPLNIKLGNYEENRLQHYLGKLGLGFSPHMKNKSLKMPSEHTNKGNKLFSEHYFLYFSVNQKTIAKSKRTIRFISLLRNRFSIKSFKSMEEIVEKLRLKKVKFCIINEKLSRTDQNTRIGQQLNHCRRISELQSTQQIRRTEPQEISIDGQRWC